MSADDFRGGIDLADYGLDEVPANRIAEQSVLGALLLDNGAFEQARALHPPHFFERHHGVIFAAMRALLQDGKPADEVTVLAQLDALGAGAECGGFQYLHALTQSVQSAAHLAQYVAIVLAKATERRILAAADDLRSAVRTSGSTAVAVARARQVIDEVAAVGEVRPPLFREIDLQGIEHHEPSPQGWHWAGYVPSGHLTMFGAHGGVGKSMIGLMLAVCAAAGRECLQKATASSRVLFFSAEDPQELVLRRVTRICRDLGIEYADVAGRLHIIDATEFDPALFVERRVDGLRTGVTTPTYAALAQFIDEHEIDLVIVDNASDTFEGDEINRAMVRAFVRSLVRLVRPRSGAVVLMAHVDKSTSRAGKGPTNTESYSGSTAWHNSARSRLFLVEKEPGQLELQHQKSNLGPKLAPLALEWPHNGLPQVVSLMSAPMQRYVDGGDVRALLSLIHEFHGRGEWVAATLQSRNNAVKLLSGEKTYPKRTPAEVFALLRDAERDGLIFRDDYRDGNRKPHTRWVLTAGGCEILGVAPSAPCAPCA